jgi:hypothetical protein
MEIPKEKLPEGTILLDRHGQEFVIEYPTRGSIFTGLLPVYYTDRLTVIYHNDLINYEYYEEN